MPLTQKQLKDVCLFHLLDSRKCRYVYQDDTDAQKWYCLKMSPQSKDINDTLIEITKEALTRGIDIKKQPIPLGDNCEGYPYLKTLEQGYDKD